MPVSELNGERIDQAYQQLADHRGIGLVFLLSLVLRVIVPIVLPNTTQLSILIAMLCVFLPIVLFFQLKGEVIKTVLAGTLTYKRAIIVGSIVGIILLLIDYVAISTIFRLIGISAFPRKEATELLKMLMHGSSGNFSMLACYALLAYISAPLGEEIVFQGWLQTKLFKKMGPIKAAFCVSAIFLFFHLTINPLLFVDLLLFALIRMKTGSLLCCWVAHAVVDYGLPIIIWIMLGVR